MQQWKHAWRSIRRRPGFSLAVCGLLSVGIAANTALFSVVDAVLLKPLPYPDPSRLVTLYEASPAKSQNEDLVAPVRLEDWNRLNHTFKAIAGSYTENVTDTSGSEPERLAGRRVSPRYFAVFGVRPVLGRTFTPEEERAGGPLAAVISYGLWSVRYGRDARITERRLVIGGRGYSIVGVMPPNFAPAPLDIWLPAQTPPFLMRLRNDRFLAGIGRVRPGVSVAQARQDLAAVQHALGEQFPATDRGWSVVVTDLKEARAGGSRNALLLLFGAVTLLLLITVSNVASLVLAQLHRRARELAIRASLGASRAQVVAALLRELVLVALAGALGGLALAAGLLPLLARFFHDVPRINELATDWRAVAFAAAASLLGASIFGLFPAWRASGASSAGTALRRGRGIAGARQGVQRVLVASQIALTMALLAGAGLLLRSFYNLSHVDLGFHPDHTIVFHVGAGWDEDRARIGRLQEQLLSELRRLPGVQAAGITNFLPAEGATLRSQVTLEGAAGADDQGKITVGTRTVSRGYLQALAAPLLAGDWCPELRTGPRGPRKALVNRRFVDTYARGHNLLGRHLRFADFGDSQHEIVGVIGDIKEDTVAAPLYPYVYVCAVPGGWPDPDYVVRTAGDPGALLAAMRQVVRRVDPARAVFGVQSMEEAIGADLERPRSNARLLAVFALAAMLLAAVGLYGLVAQMVGARRQEIGIRMALGADGTRIVTSVVTGAVRLAGAGIVAGCVLTLAAQPALRSLLFGISPLDGWNLTFAAVLLAVVAVLAAFLPARRAAAIDPVETLRAE